jgi:hypothetical protein
MSYDRTRQQKLARIDRELAQTAARQAALYCERATLLDGADEPEPVAPRRAARRPEPEISPVSDIAAQRARNALQELRTRRRVRP